MRTAFTLIILSVHLTGFGQNPLWVAKDRKLINQISHVIDNPILIQKIFEPKIWTGMNNLGFGYAMINTTAPGGYISINCTFYYLQDSLIGYAVYPRLPSESKLKNKYLEWYRAGFQLDSMTVEPYFYNIEFMRQPLSQFQLEISNNPKILEYASPESGIRYGDKGGLPLSFLLNRRLFIDLEDELNNELVLQLLYSKNPASRLTAIEYYYKNKDKFENRTQIEEWVETVFNELPYVSTIFGCIGTQEKARVLVDMFTKEIE